MTTDEKAAEPEPNWAKLKRANESRMKTDLLDYNIPIEVVDEIAVYIVDRGWTQRALSWLDPGHRTLGHCPVCTQDTTSSVGITGLAYLYKVCECGSPEHAHLVEQLYHQTCIAEAATDAATEMMLRNAMLICDRYKRGHDTATQIRAFLERRSPMIANAEGMAEGLLAYANKMQLPRVPLEWIDAEVAGIDEAGDLVIFIPAGS